MGFNVTFNNISAISWWSALLVEETGENHQPIVSQRLIGGCLNSSGKYVMHIDYIYTAQKYLYGIGQLGQIF